MAARAAGDYDAEAVFAVRDALRRRLAGETISDGELTQAIAEESQLAHGVSAVLAVSEKERETLSASGLAPVFTVGHTLSPAPTRTPFSARRGLLFVGAFYTDDSPNTDAVTWLVEEIFPRLLAADPTLTLTIAGARPTREVLALARPGVEVLGAVDDLLPLYERARLFVAPLRFATGIPYKIHHAAAHGVPVVTTRLLADQLGWQDGRQLLCAASAAELAAQCLRLHGDARLWESLRAGALEKIAEDCAAQPFSAALARALGDVEGAILG